MLYSSRARDIQVVQIESINYSLDTVSAKSLEPYRYHIICCCTLAETEEVFVNSKG